jgi:putative membrane protein insertion efficiency factor
MSPAGRAATKMIGWYQVAHADRPSPCRFVPSCSTYALDAVETRGAVVGSWLAVRRLLRCHPWGGHGYDPVPPARATLRATPHERAD